MKRTRSADEVVTVSFVDRKYHIPLSVLSCICYFEEQGRSVFVVRKPQEKHNLHRVEIINGFEVVCCCKSYDERNIRKQIQSLI